MLLEQSFVKLTFVMLSHLKLGVLLCCCAVSITKIGKPTSIKYLQLQLLIQLLYNY